MVELTLIINQFSTEIGVLILFVSHFVGSKEGMDIPRLTKMFQLSGCPDFQY